jgi:hypothetical protein
MGTLEWSQGGSVCPGSVVGDGVSGDRVAVAQGVGFHAPGAASESSPVGGSADTPPLEKNLRRRIRRLKIRHSERVVDVWAEDEARLGLKPITRRMGWLKGRRPRSCGRTKYEWLYVYGFARPRTGETVTVIQPQVTVDRMSEALRSFVAQVDPDGKKLLVLVVDRAGWHTAKRLSVPENVVLHFLPPCTPELQPVEPYWALVREAVANETFERLADLQRTIRSRCRKLAADRETVRGIVGFQWARNLES